jgi:hypothetical protein
MKGEFAPALRKVVERKVAEGAAREKGITVSDEELQRGADTMRIALNLHSAQETQEWLDASGLTLDDLEKHIEVNILMNKLKDALYQDADTAVYEKRDEVVDVVRELVFQDWLTKQID